MCHLNLTTSENNMSVLATVLVSSWMSVPECECEGHIAEGVALFLISLAGAELISHKVSLGEVGQA